MTIDQLSPEILRRGTILSIVETDRPVIESFTNGSEVYSMAFLKGIPMPYHVLVLYMAMRFAPHRSKGQMPAFYEINTFQLPMDGMLKKLWDRVELSPDTRTKISGHSRAGSVVENLVGELYSKMINEKEGTEESTTLFRSFIQRIEDDYQSSLIEPERV